MTDLTPNIFSLSYQVLHIKKQNHKIYKAYRTRGKVLH